MTSVSLIWTPATALSLLWLALLVGSGFFLLVVIGGIIFGDRRYWVVGLILVIANLLLGGVIAILDRMGHPH